MPRAERAGTGTRGLAGDTVAPWRSNRGRGQQLTFFGLSALLFAASVAGTIVWSASMSGMVGMSMPGGWTMSMAWMRMPGQSWPGAAASFVGAWSLMMVAMMLPSVVPVLWRYRESLGVAGERSPGRLAALAGVGYFSLWTLLGMVVFPAGVLLSSVVMQDPALAAIVPRALAVTVVGAGGVQLTRWKAHHLACSRELPGEEILLPGDRASAWRTGTRLGLHCIRASASLFAVLLAMGVMSLSAMAIVATAITVERLAPVHVRAARVIGGLLIGGGLLLIGRTVWGG